MSQALLRLLRPRTASAVAHRSPPPSSERSIVDDRTLQPHQWSLPLVPCFPLAGSKPGLVLYPTASGRWMLSWLLQLSAPLTALVTAFTNATAHPGLSLRLYHWDKATHWQRVASAYQAGLNHLTQGAASDAVVRPPGRYRAELGLADAAQSAWLLLARTPAVDNSAAIGSAREFPCAPRIVTTDLKIAQHSLAEPIAEATLGQSLKHLRHGSIAPRPLLVLDTLSSPLPPPVTSTRSSQASGGSGPLGPFVAPAELSLQAELLVDGRAAPGTVVTLGGKQHVVGAGGRLVLRLPVTERALLERVLQVLSS